MFAKMTDSLDFHGKALTLRAERQRVIASNIANVDTPGYVARDLNFRQAMADATGGGSARPMPAGVSATHRQHMALESKTGTLGSAANLAYATPSQSSLDGNSVDMDRERSNFADNAIRYESTLRFINGHSKTILSAITGQ
jgi:flagellar basal-body rod protein FlgB